MPVTFEFVERAARMLNPLNNFEQSSQILQHRRDPLTGRRVLVSTNRLEYVKRFIESDTGFKEGLAESTKETCPFCPENLEKSAPKFPPDLVPEGRIRFGEAVCFPSLFAHDDFNALVVPTGKHNLKLNEFSEAMLVDAFGACMEYFSRVCISSPHVKYPAIAINFLPPAGSTIAHPHIQALSSDIPLQAVAELCRASVEYEQKARVNYWTDLVDSERSLRLRYLSSFEGVHWLTPFAPFGLNEAQAVVSRRSNFGQLVSEDWHGIAEGMIRVLRYYFDVGVGSFNAVIYSGALDADIEPFRVNARIVSRYGYKPRFVSDVWALQYLLGTQEVYESPEDTCTRLTSYFHY